MLIASDIRGLGLGAFDQGSCADGADFVCKSGTQRGVTVFSCRPCDFAQLAVFRALQQKANQLVVALGMTKKPALITGPRSCEGGDILAVDERVGPCTARTISRIVRVFGPLTMAPTDPLLDLENFQVTEEYIAHSAPELITYFDQLIALTNAPKNVPAPVQQPVKGVDAPGDIPKVVLPEALPSPAQPKNGTKIMLGLLAALAAVGLVGTGVYYYRSEQA